MLSPTELERFNLQLSAYPALEDRFDIFLEDNRIRDIVYDQDRFVD